MGHCGGRPGLTCSVGQALEDRMCGYNIYRALEQWVERGSAPERLIATKYNDDRNPAQGKMTRHYALIRRSQNTKAQAIRMRPRTLSAR
jgi:hypothetical protein